MEQPLIHNADTVYIETSHTNDGWWSRRAPVSFHPFQRFCSNLAKFQHADFKALTHIFNTSFPPSDHTACSGCCPIPVPPWRSPSVTLRNATPPVQRCRPASLMMMTDPNSIGVMPVSSSQRPTKASWPRFQSCKCLVVRHLWGSVQDVQEESPYLLHICIYIYAFIIHIYKG